jgi:hypothetical protein
MLDGAKVYKWIKFFARITFPSSRMVCESNMPVVCDSCWLKATLTLLVDNIMTTTRKLHPKIDIIFFLFILDSTNHGVFIIVINTYKNIKKFLLIITKV